MSVEEVALYFLNGDPIPYNVLVPIDPQSSFYLYRLQVMCGGGWPHLCYNCGWI